MSHLITFSPLSKSCRNLLAAAQSSFASSYHQSYTNRRDDRLFLNLPTKLLIPCQSSVFYQEAQSLPDVTFVPSSLRPLTYFPPDSAPHPPPPPYLPVHPPPTGHSSRYNSTGSPYPSPPSPPRSCSWSW